MRSGLTLQQTNILDAGVKKAFWLFEVDQDNDGSADYYWSTTAKTYDGQAYDFKIMDFNPLILDAGDPGSGIIPPTKTTIRVSLPGSVIDGLYASDFEGASITIRLVCGAYLEVVDPPGEDVTEDVDHESTDYEEIEIMSWRFKVLTSTCIEQIMTWECQDFFTLYLEGDYPNTPLVSNLFPSDVMKPDNVCVPLVFGIPFFPIRWLIKFLAATFVDSDTFTVAGDQRTLFSAGQFLWAQCGNDGTKACWVDSSSYGSSITTVNLTAGGQAITSNLVTVSTDHYLLGASGVTYTINRARTPREAVGKSTYLPANYTFKQDTLAGSDGQNYKVAQLICNDADNDGTNDANGIWGVIGKEIYDLPCRFSRSDLSTKTDPAEIAEYIFEDWGIPSAEIDDTSKAAATAIFAARSFTLNIGLWYQIGREKLISKLFTASGMIPVYRDKVGFKVLTKTSQLIIEESLVKPGSFSASRILYGQSQKDSGYVTWQASTEPVDQVNKSLIAAKTTTANHSDTVIECEWVLDSQKAQKAGKLALQRILLKDQTITFTAQGKILELEPGDMITIDPANFGAEGAFYNCLITRMTIHEGLWVDVECIRFSDSLDDWDDLTATAITVNDAAMDKAFTPVYQGQADADGNAGTAPNVITQTVYIKNGADIVLIGSNTDPGIITFQGTSYKTTFRCGTNGQTFEIQPSDDDVQTFLIGNQEPTFSERFNQIKLYSQSYIYLHAGDATGTKDRSYFQIGGGEENPNFARIRIDDQDDSDYQTYDFEYTKFFPLRDKFSDLGAISQNWKNAYIDVLKLSGDLPVEFSGSMGDSSKNPASDAPADWIEIKIGLNTYYIPVYSVS